MSSFIKYCTVSDGIKYVLVFWGVRVLPDAECAGLELIEEGVVVELNESSDCVLHVVLEGVYLWLFYVLALEQRFQVSELGWTYNR